MNKALVLVAFICAGAHAETQVLKSKEATISAFSYRDVARPLVPVADCELQIDRAGDKVTFTISSASLKLEQKGELPANLIPLPKHHYKEIDQGDNGIYVGTGSSLGIGKTDPTTSMADRGLPEDSYQVDMRVRQMLQGAMERLDRNFWVLTEVNVSKIYSAKLTLDHNGLGITGDYTILECKF